MPSTDRLGEMAVSGRKETVRGRGLNCRRCGTAGSAASQVSETPVMMFTSSTVWSGTGEPSNEARARASLMRSASLASRS